MPTPMTLEGARSLRRELGDRKGRLRQEIARAIGAARAHGDLRENAEYHAAKEQQGFNEGRIKDIEGKLADAQVIDIARIPPSGKVVFGATVTLTESASGNEVRYKIVGEDEADLKQSKISVLSPIARALIGRSLGDLAVVATPSGRAEYEICRVEHL